jgi:hypothetical protein
VGRGQEGQHWPYLEAYDLKMYYYLKIIMDENRRYLKNSRKQENNKKQKPSTNKQFIEEIIIQ